MDDLDRQRLAKVTEDVAWIRATLEQLLAAINEASSHPLLGVLMGRLAKG